MDTEEQLRSVSDELLGALEQLRTLETEKRSVSPSSRRFKRLAREVESLAEGLASTAAEQVDLGDEAEAESDASGRPALPIDAIPRDVTTILAEWRDAERRLTLTAADSDEQRTARADVERLKGEYQRAHRQASTRESSAP